MTANKHEPYALKQRQSLSLEAKIILTQERIRQWYDYWCGEVYVSFSGGKDSTVLKHIIDNMTGIEDVPAVFVNTGLEYPEIQQFVRDIKAGKYPCFNSNVEIIRPEMRFDEVVKKYGYPVISKEVSNAVSSARKSIKKGVFSLRLKQLGVEEHEYGGLYNSGEFDYERCVAGSKFNKSKWRFLLDSDFELSDKCCDVMKKAPAKKYGKETGRKPIIATMAAESKLRETMWMKYGCNAFEKGNPTSQPMSFWTEQDVLQYIKKYLQKDLDDAWKNINSPCKKVRKNARKYVRKYHYAKRCYASVYGDIRVKMPNTDTVSEGQINMIDYLGCYEPEDTLETTGCNRTGCIFCMFGCHLEKEPNRFQRLKQTHPRQYDYCINGGEMVDGKWQPSKEGLGLGKVLEYIGVGYE